MLVIFLIGILLLGAAAAGASFPVLLLTGCLILIALDTSSTRDERQE